VESEIKRLFDVLVPLGINKEDFTSAKVSAIYRNYLAFKSTFQMDDCSALSTMQ
tara:strand:- start:394 stop:555 length:162 start_codon:yes stop_codon:yes gene_type:complete